MENVENRAPGPIVNAVQKRKDTSFEPGGESTQLENRYLPIFKCVYDKDAELRLSPGPPGFARKAEGAGEEKRLDSSLYGDRVRKLLQEDVELYRN